MNRSIVHRALTLGIVGAAAGIAFGASPSTETTGAPMGPDLVELYGAGTDPGRPFTINIAGATLMENFIRAPASTNDFLDIDGDGRTVPDQVDNLAGSRPANPYNAALWWVVQYRVVGSVNGFQELLDYGQGCATAADIGNPAGGGIPNNPPNALSSDACQLAYVNSEQYIVNGQPGGPASAIFNAFNPGGLPTRTFCVGTIPAGKQLYSAAPLSPGVASSGGTRIDIAPIDVPSFYAVQAPGTTFNFDDIPLEDGYGGNPRLSRALNGTPALDGVGGTFGFRLANFAGYNFAGAGVPNAQTIYDTEFAYIAISIVVNHGVGRQTATYSTLRHLWTTGRTETGENLMAITRDTGSGTHNAVMTTLAIDPSHGVGEARGVQSAIADEQVLGPFFIPGNKAGNSGIEATAQNHRLGIGYAGAERGTTGSGTGSWLTTGRLETLALRDDLNGGTVFARPTIANVLGFQTIDFTPPYNHVPLANRYDGYNIGGFGVLSTIGDPRSSLNVDSAGVPVLGTDPANTNPPMRNPQAAAYLNNITRSTEAFVALGTDPTLFSPGEFLAQTFIINGSRAYTQNRFNPSQLLAPNQPGGVAVNDALVDEVATLNRLNLPAYVSYGAGASGNINGRTPTRFAFVDPSPAIDARRYSDTAGINDGGADRRVFVRQNGTVVGYDNTAINSRNRIAGDFNGDGLRNVNDAEQMVRAFNDRINRPVAYGSPTASLTAPSVADRDAWQGGLAGNATFGDRATNWVAPNGTGAIAGAPGGDAIIEVLGDFNGDGNFGRAWVAGAFVTDTSDIRYWADGLAIDPATGRLNRAAGFTAVDTAALAVLGTNNFFGTTLARGTYDAGDSVADVAGSGGFTIGFAPIGHDGVVNAADIDYVFAQFARNPNVTDGALNWSNLVEAQWATNAFGEEVGNLSADLTGDLIVDINDIDRLFQILETTRCDVNLDGVVDAADRAIIEANIGTSNRGFANGDVDGNGAVTQADLQFCFAAPVCCPGDSDDNGTINFSDITATLANFGSTTVGGTNGNGDADCSGTVTFSDITTVLANFGSSCN